MIRIGLTTWLMIAASVTLTLAARAADNGSAFTYQGELALDSQLVSTACDFRFSLWDDVSSTDLLLAPVAALLYTRALTGVRHQERDGIPEE